MYRSPLVVLLLTAATAILLPATASAITLTRHLSLPHGVTGKAEVQRVAQWHVGLDSDGDGIWNGPDDCSHQDGPRSAGGCKPAPLPEPEPDFVTSTEQTPASTTYSVPAYTPPATSSGGCPSYMSGEATSPTAVNPSSGASGCYQVLPSTADAMGPACSDVNSSTCVAAICAAQGNDAWSASGATPCG